MNPRLRLALIGSAFLLASTGAARVHPHVFAEARLDVMLSQDRRTVESLRHLWRFDDVFSSTVLMEFDKNADLTLDDAELQEVAATVNASIAEYGYFQVVMADGKEVAMSPPPSLMVNYEGDQLVILFETRPSQPLGLAGTLAFGVYDPTFYTAIEFTEDENMAVADLPSSCTRRVVRPDPDEALAQNEATLTEAFFNDPAGTDLSKIFATRLELGCKAEG